MNDRKPTKEEEVETKQLMMMEEVGKVLGDYHATVPMTISAAESLLMAAFSQIAESTTEQNYRNLVKKILSEIGQQLTYTRNITVPKERCDN